ncbi:ABC transporter permease [Devosia nitrariae]|uniref:ABC transporter permease n=1 Tax=Devosia nitrariae TaxID=2071872 RepID=A0ABQ5W4N7_9HYPH|nr:ABC transporter permease [Devosia nitrariae]GLQ54728.1 ABC transporter permease [Devosia nitrariae]
MLAFIRGRLLSGLLTIFGVVVLVFFLARLTGSPIDLFFPEGATQAQLESFSRAHGLDRPLLEQFWVFLSNAARGDFGMSIWQQRPALQAALSEMPATLMLTFLAMTVSVIIAVVLGTIAAAFRFRLVDRIITILTLATGSIPHFWFALVSILVFAIILRLVPTSGAGNWQSWILPVATVSLGPIGILTQVTRGAMIEVLSSGFVRNARARGFGSTRILYRHALRNAALPIIAVAGDIAAGMVNGAIIVSVVFAFPGIGKAIIGAVLARDFPVLQACIVVVGIAVVLLNLIIDLIYVVVDPRVRLS